MEVDQLQSLQIDPNILEGQYQWFVVVIADEYRKRKGVPAAPRPAPQSDQEVVEGVSVADEPANDHQESVEIEPTSSGALSAVVLALGTTQTDPSKLSRLRKRNENATREKQAERWTAFFGRQGPAIRSRLYELDFGLADGDERERILNDLEAGRHSALFDCESARA